MSEPKPITGIITWAAQSGPNVPSQHRYRASVNIAEGMPIELHIGRPGTETWFPDQLVYPLKIGARVHGVQVGDHFQWEYVERPVISTCDGAAPFDPPTEIPGGGITPRPGSPIHPAPSPVPVGTGGAQLRMNVLRAIMLTATEKELADFWRVAQAAAQSQAAEKSGAAT